MARLTDTLKKKLCGSGANSVRPASEIGALIENGAFVLDVRAMLETHKGVAPGATTIPLLRLTRHLDELPRDQTIVTYCSTGARAGKARDILEAGGFTALNGGGYDRMVEILKATQRTAAPKTTRTEDAQRS